MSDMVLTLGTRGGRRQARGGGGQRELLGAAMAMTFYTRNPRALMGWTAENLGVRTSGHMESIERWSRGARTGPGSGDGCLMGKAPLCFPP